MPESGISKCISLPTPFSFIFINLCQFLKNLFWGEGMGTEVMSYSELKADIHAARGKTVEKNVSV